MFYDPELDRDMAHGSLIGLGVAWYMLPQDCELSEELFEAAKREAGWQEGGNGGLVPGMMFNILGLLLAQEFGDRKLAARLRAALERVAEPRTDFDSTGEVASDGDGRDDCGEFGYFFHLGERWPRGQMSALLACAEVCQEGQWRAFFATTPEEHASRLAQPTVEGVEFPSLGISLAENSQDLKSLHIRTYAATPKHIGKETTFRIANLPPQSNISVDCDGAAYQDWRHIGSTSIEISCQIDDHSFVVHMPVGEAQARL